MMPPHIVLKKFILSLKKLVQLMNNLYGHLYAPSCQFWTALEVGPLMDHHCLAPRPQETMHIFLKGMHCAKVKAVSH